MPRKLAEDASEAQVIRYMGAMLLQQEILDRCGEGRKVFKGERHKICEDHNFTWIKKSKTFSHQSVKSDGTQTIVSYSHRFNLYVPEAEGPKSTEKRKANRTASGLGDQQSVRQKLEYGNKPILSKTAMQAEMVKIKYDESVASLKSEVLLAKSDGAEAMKALQQKYAGDENCEFLDPSVAREAGLSGEKLRSPPVKVPGKKFFSFEHLPANNTQVSQPGKKVNCTWKQKPAIHLDIRDRDAKQRTG